MSKFPTPRLLLEIRRDNVWQAAKIFCDYPNARSLFSDLPTLAQAYDIDMNDLRVKNLLSDQAIADAKQAVYDNQRKRPC